MTQFRGDFDAALGIYVESLEVSRSSNDQRRIAQSLRGIAAIEYMQSDLASARERINEALEICRSINDDFGSGAALARLGDIAFSEGDMSEARLRSAEALAIFTRLGYAQGIASKLGNLGTAELLDGEIELAAVHMRQCLDTCIEIGDEVNIRLVLEGFAALMFDAGDHRNAARLFGAAEGLGDAIEFVLEPAERRFHDIYYQKLLDVSNADEFAKAHAEGRRMNGTEAVSLALSFDERDLS